MVPFVKFLFLITTIIIGNCAIFSASEGNDIDEDSFSVAVTHKGAATYSISFYVRYLENDTWNRTYETAKFETGNTVTLRMPTGATQMKTVVRGHTVGNTFKIGKESVQQTMNRCYTVYGLEYRALLQPVTCFDQ